MDIVTELRQRIEEVYGGHGTVLEYPDDLCHRAAREIERLRAASGGQSELPLPSIRQRTAASGCACHGHQFTGTCPECADPLCPICDNPSREPGSECSCCGVGGAS